MRTTFVQIFDDSILYSTHRLVLTTKCMFRKIFVALRMDTVLVNNVENIMNLGT